MNKDKSLEQIDDSNFLTDILCYIIIAMTYAIILTMFVEKISENKEANKACTITIEDLEKSKDNSIFYKTMKQCNEVTNKQIMQKYTYTILLTIASAVAGVFIVKTDDNYRVLGAGITYGGVLLFITQSFGNWDVFNYETKMFILISVLVFFGYSSVIINSK